MSKVPSHSTHLTDLTAQPTTMSGDLKSWDEARTASSRLVTEQDFECLREVFSAFA